MYFDFRGTYLETPTVESAVSRRESLLVSLFLHLVVFAILVLIPELPVFRAAAERQAARLEELAELQRQREREQDRDRFVFVEPLFDIEAFEPLEEAVLSDKDRVATAPERAEMPTNDLPLALGNSFEQVEAERPTEGLSELAQVDPGNSERMDLDQLEGAGEDTETVIEEKDEIGKGLESGLESLLARQAGDEPETEVRENLLGDALRNLDRYASQESFHNPTGDASKYGPWIQFDTKGVEFGPWIRRFVAQVRRNWQMPYAALSMQGHVVITFYVHKDGTMSEFNVVGPSTVEGFNNAALNALLWSTPTHPLPPEYPSDRAFFTVTFFYNETPPPAN